MSFKIPGKAGRSTERKAKKKKPSASWIDRVLKNEVLGHVPYDEAASFGLGVRSHAEYKRAFGPSAETYESLRTMSVGFLSCVHAHIYIYMCVCTFFTSEMVLSFYDATSCGNRSSKKEDVKDMCYPKDQK